MADYPYEKRKDNGGKLICKDKVKSFPNKNNFSKKMPQKVLVAQEEYLSDVDDDDDEIGEVIGMAMEAIASSAPSKVSLFDAPNENHIAKCLMSKATNKVTANIKTTISTTHYPMDSGYE